MKYCIRCVQPDSRPGIYFSPEGICGACLWEDTKKNIDWAERTRELKDLCAWAKKEKKESYDCAIGVSGGKDSTFQACYARDVLGLHPLLVNNEPEHITEIGQSNIENLKNLGFDVISVRPNPKIMKKLMRFDFFEILNPIRSCEYALYASTFIIAEKFSIPLIIQGENPGQTLGTSQNTGTSGDAYAIAQHHTIKTNPFDLYQNAGVTKDELFLYHFDPDKMKRLGIKAIFLSNYAKEWGQPYNARFAIARGLRIRPASDSPYERGAYRQYAQLDSDMVHANQLLKYIKYGFGQTTDMVGYDIRDGEVSREEGIFLVKELDGKCAPRYIEWMCKTLDISVEQFWQHANTYRGNMWERQANDTWKLRSPIWERFPVSEDFTVENICKRLHI